jgi:hypothetical protein
MFKMFCVPACALAVTQPVPIQPPHSAHASTQDIVNIYTQLFNFFYPASLWSGTKSRPRVKTQKPLYIKGQVVSVHIMIAHRGNRGTAPLILNLGTVWKRKDYFKLRPL